MARQGRRTVLVRVVFLMAGATTCVALLPGYATIGLLAPVVLVLLRAAQGLTAGGELGIAAVFILENAHHARRGQTAAWHTAMAIGIGTGMAMGGVLSSLFSETGLDSGWWRIAFLLAFPLGFIGVQLRRRVAETPQFEALRTDSRLVDHLARELWTYHRSAVLGGFCLIAAGSLAFNTFFIFMPNNLISRRGGELGPVLLVTASALGVVAIAAVALGRLSDHIGRRPVVVGSTAALLILPLSDEPSGSTRIARQPLRGRGLGRVAVAGVLSVAMLGELFAVPVRSTGFALTAGLATAIIGGTCAVWLPNFSSPLLILRPDRGSMLRHG